MAGTIRIGPVVRRLRERWRLTQQDVVEYARLERSSSYVSSIETGKTSPTLDEIAAMATVFRTTLLDMIREAQGEQEEAPPAEGGDNQAQVLFSRLSSNDQDLALDFMKLLAERAKRP